MAIVQRSPSINTQCLVVTVLLFIVSDVHGDNDVSKKTLHIDYYSLVRYGARSGPTSFKS